MKCLMIAAGIFISAGAAAQQQYNGTLLDTLARITNTGTPSRYFAKLYYQAIQAANKYAAKQPG